MKSTFSSIEFIKLFNEIKTREKGRKGVARGLSDKDERNFKKLLKRGFEIKDFELAITQMFQDPSQWAVSSGNDIPTHFLRSDNFERYLNAALNKQKEEEQKEAVKIAKSKPEETNSENDLQAKEFLNRSREIYEDSLLCGKWLGNKYNANVIARDLAVSIDKSEKDLIWREIQEKNQIHKEVTGGFKYADPVREFSNRIVELCVEKKIKKAW